MTHAQRSALLGMLGAIRACSSCPPDIRFRADSLEERLNPIVPSVFIVVLG